MVFQATAVHGMDLRPTEMLGFLAAHLHWWFKTHTFYQINSQEKEEISLPDEQWPNIIHLLRYQVRQGRTAVPVLVSVAPQRPPLPSLWVRFPSTWIPIHIPITLGKDMHQICFLLRPPCLQCLLSVPFRSRHLPVVRCGNLTFFEDSSTSPLPSWVLRL